jgi:hypothetical protein
MREWFKREPTACEFARPATPPLRGWFGLPSMSTELNTRVRIHRLRFSGRAIEVFLAWTTLPYSVTGLRYSKFRRCKFLAILEEIPEALNSFVSEHPNFRTSVFVVIACGMFFTSAGKFG